MALLFADGFESFGTTAGSVSGLGNKYTAGANHNSDTLITGRYGGLAYYPRHNTSGAGTNFDAALGADFASVVVGFAVRLAALPTSTRRLIEFVSTGSVVEAGIAITTTGQLIVYNSSISTIRATSSSSNLFTLNKWHYLEVKITINNSGSWTLQLDDAAVSMSADTGDTQATNANCNVVRFLGQSTTTNLNSEVHFDDVYVLSTTGAPDDFLGPQHIYTTFPNATGDDADFTPSAGDNYEAVDDNPHDTDTTYVEDDTLDQKDLYNWGSVSISTAINAVILYAIARRTDVTSFSFIAVASSDSTEADGATQTVNTATYGPFYGVFLVDPDTTSAWTDTGINAAQFGYKVG